MIDTPLYISSHRWGRLAGHEKVDQRADGEAMQQETTLCTYPLISGFSFQPVPLFNLTCPRG